MFTFQVCFIVLVRCTGYSGAYDLASNSIYVEIVPLLVTSLIFNSVFQQWIKNPARLPGPNQQEDIRQSQAGDMEEDMHMSVLNHV